MPALRTDAGSVIDVMHLENKLGTGNSKVFVGIDPGTSGGIAILNPFGQHTLESFSNKTDRQIWELFRFIDPSHAKAVIEKNSGYIGGDGNPGSAMFVFGCNTGKLLGWLTAADVPFEECTPAKWQKSVGVVPRKKSESKSQFKRRLKQHAERLYPGLPITLATADALLIAHYCKIKNGGAM